MKNTSMFLAFIGILCLIFSLSGCESGRDQQHANDVAAEVFYPALIKNKICLTTDSCKLMNLCRSSLGDQIGLNIYVISDRQIINDVISNMLSFTKQLPRNKTFSISFYSVSEQEVGFFDKPIAQLTIQGER